MVKVRVNTKPGYDVLIGRGVFLELPSVYASSFAPRVPIVITNEKVYTLWRERIDSLLLALGSGRDSLLLVPDSESAKSVSVFSTVVERIAKLDARRTSVAVIAVGGGVVGDLAGFVAGTYRRGVPVIQVPTTLLAQIDSAIGGKTALNLKEAKNLVGVYHQPSVVFVDVDFLSTLEEEQLKEGISEGIKYGVIRSPKLFSYLEKFNVEEIDWTFFVRVCVEIKARVVSVDEKETKGLRYILNFGHTVGHALEVASNHRLSHGQAVALGMIAAGFIGVKKKLCSPRTLLRIERTIDKFGLPLRVGYNVDRGVLMDSLLRDKKFSRGRFRFVLPRRIGWVEVREDVVEEDVSQALDYITR